MHVMRAMCNPVCDIHAVHVCIIILQVKYIVVTSHRDRGVSVITLHSRFVVENSSSDSVRVSAVISPVSSDRLAIDCVQRNPQELAQGQVLSLEHHRLSLINAPVHSAAALLVTFSYTAGAKGWSYPVQVPMESADRRLGVFLPSGSGTKGYCLSTHLLNGVTYLVFSDSISPHFVIHNHCPLALAYGQTLTAGSEEVLEAMSLLAEPPVVYALSSASYTFPTVTKLFPAYASPQQYPKLKLAGQCLLISFLRVTVSSIDLLSLTTINEYNESMLLPSRTLLSIHNPGVSPFSLVRN